MNENREAARTIEAAIEEHRSRHDAGTEPINPECFDGLTVGDLMTALDGREAGCRLRPLNPWEDDSAPSHSAWVAHGSKGTDRPLTVAFGHSFGDALANLISCLRVQREAGVNS